MDGENRMKILVFRFWKEFHVAQGWSPNWDRYTRWLKERKHRAEKMRLEREREKREERARQNDKVLRSYGLGKYQRKGDW